MNGKRENNMKKAFVLFLVIATLFCAAGLAEPLMGGWAPVEDGMLTEEAVAALEKALEGFVGSSVKPVTLLSTQVVAGTNYCILCTITPVVPDAQPHWSLVYVYEDLSGNAQLMGFVDLEFALPQPEEEEIF